jgi:TolA-binding protein
LAQVAFAKEEWPEAERRFRDIVETFPNTDAAPEALYWAGVAKYKGTGDATALGNTASAFKKRYADSTWAKKASVWAA